MINILRTEVDGLWCRIHAEGGTFERWPGRTVNGRQCWGYRPTGGQPMIATVPETIDELERAFQDARADVVEASMADHPSSQPKRRHLTLVPALDWTPPFGMTRPA